MIIVILNISTRIIGNIIIYTVPTMFRHRRMLTDMRGTITVITGIIVITTTQTVRRGGAFSNIITVTRSVVVISSIIIKISIVIIMVNVTVDLGCWGTLPVYCNSLFSLPLLP